MTTTTEPAVPEPHERLITHGHANVLEAMQRRLVQDRGGNRKSLPEPRPYVYASGWDDCTRRMYHDVVDHYRRGEWNAEVLARFARGNDREDALRIWMDRAGVVSEPRFRVYGAQDEIALRDSNGRMVLKGKVDSILEFDGGPKLAIEFKSWSPYVVERIDRYHDLLSSPYTKKAAYQLAAYVWGKGLPGAWLVLDQFSGMPKIIPVTADECIHAAERFWSRAETVMSLVHDLAPRGSDDEEAQAFRSERADERLRDYQTTNADHCRRCWANGLVCFPAEENPGEARVETDADVIAEVDRMVELATAAHEYASIKRRVDKRFRGVEFAIVGDYVGRGKWSKSTTYRVPADVKERYKHVEEHGRFSIEWERAEAQAATTADDEE